MNIERMMKIRAVLRDAVEGRLPPGIDKFDMGHWRTKFTTTCSTAACAIGLYLTAYSEHEDGFRLAVLPGGRSFIPILGAETFAELVGIEAVATHLDIDIDEAHHLFDYYSYEDDMKAAQVLERLERFIAFKG